MKLVKAVTFIMVCIGSLLTFILGLKGKTSLEIFWAMITLFNLIMFYEEDK